MNGNGIDLIDCMAALPGSLGWLVWFDPVRFILQIRRLIFFIFIDERRVVKKSKKIEPLLFDLAHFRMCYMLLNMSAGPPTKDSKHQIVSHQVSVFTPTTTSGWTQIWQKNPPPYPTRR